MKLKREQTSFINLSKVFKGLLFFSFLLLTNAMWAQVVSITPDTDGAEVSAPGSPNVASFTISRDISPITGTNVDYVVTGTSTSGVDHDLVNGTVNLNFLTPGAAVTTIINILDDDLVEGLETIVITLTAVTGGTIDPNADELTINIEDNDVGVLTLDLDTTIINGFEPEAPEGSNPPLGQFRLESDKRNETGATVLVTFTVAGTATPGPGAGAAFDYDFTGAVNVANTRITLPTNTQFRNVNVIPWDDNIAEPDKTVIITLTGTNNPLFTIGASNTATITITDDDCAAGVTAPTLNSQPTTLCDVSSVDLNDYDAGMVPLGASRRFSNFPNPTEAQILTGTAVTAAGAGIYYMLYASGTGASFCTSPSTELEIILNTSPSAGTAIAGLERCNQAGFGPVAINLNNAVSGEDTGGTWTYISGGTGNPGISAAGVVNFTGDPADTYVFRYTVVGMAPCLNDTTDVAIEVSNCDPCVAGTTAPPLNNAIATDRCDEASVNLNTFIIGGTASAPAGTSLRWSTIPNPSTSSDLILATVGASGTYYGVYWDNANSCASPATRVDLVLNESPDAGANANGSACNNPNTNFGATTLDLDNLLAAGVDAGTWAWTSGPLTLNPNANNVVQFSNRPAGMYK